MIENIENGMELAVVRKILNQLIDRVNELEKISRSYDDLENRPAIDGVTLTSKTTMRDFKIPVSSMENYEELQRQILEISSTTAQSTATEAASKKLDGDFTTLQGREYELGVSMLVAIDTGKGEVFKATLGDLITYLKHEVLKLNDQYLRVIK